MKLIPLAPKRSLNPAFLKQRPLRSEIDLFKTNLTSLLDKIKVIENRPKDESEEHLKNDVRDFLRDTFYKESNAINTKDKQDLVIHLGKTTDTEVGVIIEAKRPGNTSQMVTSEDPNAKALHELILYYLRERDEENNNLKFCVATNINEWYIIDANQFDKHIARNSKIKKLYATYKNDKKDTPFFYEEVAKIIPQIEVDIPCTYFSIKDYKKALLAKEGDEEEKKLIALFKILSPYHLLKAPFADDSNKLDEKFYKELLHIIGLEETKLEGRPIIRRKPNNLNSGSLIENVIEQIKDELHKVNDLKNYGETTEEQTFNIALELCITWINRILFLKLLEGQLLAYHKGNKAYRFLNKETIHNFDELAKLFHKVLAVNTADRTPLATKEKFKLVPYLNSSLFDSTDLEDHTIKINALDNDLPLDFLSNTILKEQKKKNNQLPVLEYLFLFLDAYDFASEGKEDIQEDTKTLINASVLGKVFEKINGYKDGSIFTPGFITMYMCRQAIRLAVVQKFNEVKKWNIEEFSQLYNKIEDTDEANLIINDLKICDPAVGSGHFLVSALNEIIAIKSELKILKDRAHNRLKEYSVEIVNDELIVRDEDGDIFEYNPLNAETLRVQSALFHEKQTIIENCLFGVDINPKSVLICRLRLWIELLKNAYYKTSSTGNEELETLPNIDINIKCGNSLLSRFPLNTDLTEAFKKQQFTLKTYKLAVETYRSATDKNAKRELLELMEKIKKEYTKTIFLKDQRRIKVSEARGLLELAKNNYDLFGKKISEKDKDMEVRRLTLLLEQRERELEEAEKGILYRNAFEWRFEFPEVLNPNGDYVGFDSIIGNPPYIAIQKMRQEQKGFETQHYETYTKLADIYCLFYEKGIQLLKDKGTLTYITSNSWLRTQYGELLRKYFIEKANPIALLNIEDKQVFDQATVESNIITVKKEPYKKQLQAATIKEDFNPAIPLHDYFAAHEARITELPISGWTIGNELEGLLKAKMEDGYKKLIDWDIKMNFGIKTGFNKAFIMPNDSKDTLVSKNKNNEQVLLKVLRGKDVQKYAAQFANLYIVNTHNGILLEKSVYKTNVVTEGKQEVLHWQGNKIIVHRKEEVGTKKWRINRIIAETDFPEVYAYLKDYSTELKKREDQGEHWSNLRSCDYIYDFQKPKIIWGEISDSAKFAYDDEGLMVNDRCSIIVGQHLKYLLALLNSKAIGWYFNQISTSSGMGTAMWKQYKMEQFPIPVPDEATEKKVEQLVNHIISIKKARPLADTTEWETQLDALVFHLYKLTNAEALLVLNSFKDISALYKNQSLNHLEDIGKGRWRMKL